MMRLVQLRSRSARRVALVDEPSLRLLSASFPTILVLAQAALNTGEPLTAFVRRHLSTESIAYDPVYRGQAEWQLLPAIDHPAEPARCLVSGTGLTHLGSAKNRNAMHTATDAETDSMRMFRWGIEAGKPPPGQPGVPPEWFYKGCGTVLRAPAESLDVPSYAESGGEEAEIAGVYLIGNDAKPWRIGMAVGNEFSDHKFERKNYLNLAGSKIRTCALGPELVVDPSFKSVCGTVTIERAGATVWTQSILTGEAEMCHSLANIEYHHFKYETHRRPGDLHVHYYGACTLSSGAGVSLADGDVMAIAFENFGRALRNTVRIVPGPPAFIAAASLG